jgi:hypothetical protein
MSVSDPTPLLSMRPPPPEDDDPEEVSDKLAIASALWARGEHGDAVGWVRRAAESASDAERDDRALALAKAASGLSDAMSQHPPPAAPQPAPAPALAPAPATSSTAVSSDAAPQVSAAPSRPSALPSRTNAATPMPGPVGPRPTTSPSQMPGAVGRPSSRPAAVRPHVSSRPALRPLGTGQPPPPRAPSLAPQRTPVPPVGRASTPREPLQRAAVTPALAQAAHATGGFEGSSPQDAAPPSTPTPTEPPPPAEVTLPGGDEQAALDDAAFEQTMTSPAMETLHAVEPPAQASGAGANLPPLFTEDDDEDADRTSQIAVNPSLLSSMRLESRGAESVSGITATQPSSEVRHIGEPDVGAPPSSDPHAEPTAVNVRIPPPRAPRSTRAVAVLVVGKGDGARIEIDRGQHADGATRALLVPLEVGDDLLALLS